VSRTAAVSRARTKKTNLTSAATAHVQSTQIAGGAAVALWQSSSPGTDRCLRGTAPLHTWWCTEHSKGTAWLLPCSQQGGKRKQCPHGLRIGLLGAAGRGCAMPGHEKGPQDAAELLPQVKTARRNSNQ